MVVSSKILSAPFFFAAVSIFLTFPFRTGEVLCFQIYGFHFDAILRPRLQAGINPKLVRICLPFTRERSGSILYPYFFGFDILGSVPCKHLQNIGIDSRRDLFCSKTGVNGTRGF